MTKHAASEPPPLYELEAAIMEEVWRLGRATPREVMEALNARSTTQRAYTTIMTVMARLERKGVLEREMAGKGYIYTPRTSRKTYIDSRARAEVDALVEEYGEAALVHFARQMSQLDPKRRGRLRRLARRA